ncbi:thymidine phosphorylase [Candidatus Gottesmanbacteria bacterium]|nr:thymidine phosphorylase [Candidatus Gottesmanbacteria bacterium]
MPPDVNQKAIDAIKKKLVGKSLSYDEIFSIMDSIAHERLGPVLTTYFAAAGFKEGFSDTELYHLTQAMVATGPKLHFKGIVADKHSTGGVAGTRTTMIVVPIVAAAGFLIPKNSSRAITSPAGTADTMEVLAPVTFSPHQIERIALKAGGCIVWGGHLGLAPADDVLIRVEEPLAFESFDKIIVSIMAKKIASGATHLVLDVPVGPTMKIAHFHDAEIIARKFTYLARKFNIKVSVDVNEIRQNAGRGIGPMLEARDVLQVLEQKSNRPLALEAKALRLAGKLLDLCFSDSKDAVHPSGEEVARDILVSGNARKKMGEIIRTQGGDPSVESASLKMSKHTYEYRAETSGQVCKIQNQQITVICRILGCPTDKLAGLYIHKRLEEKVARHDILCTLYSSDTWRLKEASESLKHIPIFTIE